MNSDPRLIPPNPSDCKPIARPSHATDMMYRLQRMLMRETPNMPNTQSCLTCAKFDEPSEWCKFFGGRPPARVITYSCGTRAYEDRLDLDDDIPF